MTNNIFKKQYSEEKLRIINTIANNGYNYTGFGA